jgi:hypothetical protein
MMYSSNMKFHYNIFNMDLSLHHFHEILYLFLYLLLFYFLISILRLNSDCSILMQFYLLKIFYGGNIKIINKL